MAEALPSELSRVDPADAWAPYKPSAAAPWDRKCVAHLYRRAAFGPSPADTDRALADGFEKTLDRLMAGEPDARDRLDLLLDAGQYCKDALQLRVWWLYAMIESGHPLREKLTLFWHNHFATSYAKVQRTRLMFEQNLTLRKHALGKFRPFLLDMSRDTAMLKWLDSNQNVKGAPNENYAREVMELFSLGVGNYTEKDIQEAARAFTGWHVDSRTDEDEDTFQFKPVLHDDGPKTVFGKTGNWNGDDIVRLCCDQPACARFLVGKLYAFLVSETPPPKGLLAPLEERFRGTDYDIADLVQAMLGSRLFFSAHAYRKRVKWPVEYALGAVRAVVPPRPPADPDHEFYCPMHPRIVGATNKEKCPVCSMPLSKRKKERDWVPLADFADPLAKMGQVLFAPPNVKGWRTGTDWLNSATLLARNNFAETVATGSWPRTSTRGNRGATFATATKAPVGVVDTAAAGSVVETPDALAAEAAIGGGAASYAPVRVMIAPDGTRNPVPVITADGPGDGPPGSSAPPSAAGSTAGAPPGRPPGPAAPPQPVDPKFDPDEVLFNPKPASVSALVKRMAELLYGEQVSPAARGKVEKFLLAGKSTLGEKDLDNPAFRQKAREALHALMCLPEYQLN